MSLGHCAHSGGWQVFTLKVLGNHYAMGSWFNIRIKTWSLIKYFMHIHIVEYYIAMKKDEERFVCF